MSIIARLIRRNITGKPLRSAAIIIALAASAFALLFCVEGREAPAQEIRNKMLKAYGGAEILVIDSKLNIDISSSDLPDGTVLLLTSNGSGQITTAKDSYNVTFRGIDPQGALDFGFNDTLQDPKDGIIISQALADKSGAKVGDTVTVSRNDNKMELKITEISTDKYLRNYSDRALISVENAKKLLGATGTGYSGGYVDLPDDVEVLKVVADLQKKYPEITFMQVYTEEIEEDINNQTTVFYLIFAVILLMTLFLTASMSKHIANERLSAIGTLRSLGGSLRKTSMILMIESGVYGLVGGILGAVGYYFAGDFAIGAFFGGSTSQEYDLAVWMYPVAVAAAILIQLACQSGALIKAVKTPVRDIIFSSRDTAYHLNPIKICAGLVLLAGGIVLGTLAEEMILTIAAISLICLGMLMALPILLKFISRLLVKLFAALGMPVAKLASSEIQHKKSTVTGTQLTFVALTITTAIFITVQSVSRLYNAEVYNFDARINSSITEEESGIITDMPEVTKAEFVYSTITNGGINGGKKHYVCLAAYGKYELFTSIHGLGEEPAEGEAYIGETFASKNGLKEGDTFEITDYDNYELTESGEKKYSIYKFKVKGLCDTMDHFNETVVVNKAWYRKEIYNRAQYIYVKLSSPTDIETVRKKLADERPNDDIISAASLKLENEEDMNNIMTILYAITAVGCVLALLGAVSNAVIGFEQSKRKYAVLHSVAASKSKLKKLIMLETLLSSVISGCLAMLAGLLLSKLIKNAMTNLGMGIEVVYNIPMTALFVIALVAVLLLAAIKPMFSLSKMNTAAELKYE